MLLPESKRMKTYTIKHNDEIVLKDIAEIDIMRIIRLLDSALHSLSLDDSRWDLKMLISSNDWIAVEQNPSTKQEFP